MTPPRQGPGLQSVVAPGQQLTVCLTFDCDSMSVWPTAFNQPGFSAMSRGEFEGQVGFGRILDLLGRHEVPGTFFVPGFTLLAYPEHARRASADGHEIGFHGWMHEIPVGRTTRELKGLMDKGLEAHLQVTGSRPRGYRTPGGEIPAEVVDLLSEYEFTYEATLSTLDFAPWYLRRGDVYSPAAPFAFGELTDIVAMPFSWALNDFQQFEFVSGWSTLMRSPQQVREIWQAEFDYASDEVSGGVFVICMHPQVMGRGSRFAMLDELITYMKGRNARFATMGEYVELWKANNPVSAWASQNPELAGMQSGVGSVSWGPARHGRGGNNGGG